MFTDAKEISEITKQQIMIELQGTDIASARVAEEIAEQLLNKNTIKPKELSMYAQDILSRQKILRVRYRRL